VHLQSEAMISSKLWIKIVKIFLEKLKNAIDNELAALEETKQLKNVQQLLDKQVTDLTEKNKLLLKLAGETDVTCENVKAQNQALNEELNGLKEEIQEMKKQIKKNAETTAQDTKRYAERADATQKPLKQNKELTNDSQNFQTTCNVIKNENTVLTNDWPVLKKNQRVLRLQPDRPAKTQQHVEFDQMPTSELTSSKKFSGLSTQMQTLQNSCKELKTEKSGLVGDIALLKKKLHFLRSEKNKLRKQVKDLERTLHFSQLMFRGEIPDHYCLSPSIFDRCVPGFMQEKFDHLSLNIKNLRSSNFQLTFALIFLCVFVILDFKNFGWWISIIIFIFVILSFVRVAMMSVDLH